MITPTNYSKTKGIKTTTSRWRCKILKKLSKSFPPKYLNYKINLFNQKIMRSDSKWFKIGSVALILLRKKKYFSWTGCKSFLLGMRLIVVVVMWRILIWSIVWECETIMSDDCDLEKIWCFKFDSIKYPMFLYWKIEYEVG